MIYSAADVSNDEHNELLLAFMSSRHKPTQVSHWKLLTTRGMYILYSHAILALSFFPPTAKKNMWSLACLLLRCLHQPLVTFVLVYIGQHNSSSCTQPSLSTLDVFRHGTAVKLALLQFYQHKKRKISANLY